MSDKDLRAVRRSIRRHLLAGVRTPQEREGDLAAQLAGLATGDRRLRALVARYGRVRIEAMGSELLAYTSRAVRTMRS